jgi:hypothetical protein
MSQGSAIRRIAMRWATKMLRVRKFHSSKQLRHEGGNRVSYVTGKCDSSQESAMRRIGGVTISCDVFRRR